jgi:hypothetical protein
MSEHIDKMNETFFLFVDRVITLSTGALALSITFRTSFSKAEPTLSWILKVSWIAYVIAILAGVLLLFGRAESHRRSAKFQKEKMKEPPPVKPYTVTLPPPGWLPKAAWTMAVSFVIGIVALATFAIINVP